MVRFILLFLFSFSLFFNGYAQIPTPFYKNASPSRATGNVGNNMPFGNSSALGIRLQAFYPPGLFGSTVPTGGITMNRLYFFADTTSVDTMIYSNLTIVLGELSSAPGTAFVWNTASRMTTVISGGGNRIIALDTNWFYIDLTTPYVYDPSKYLMVDFTINGQTPFIFSWNTKSGPSSGTMLSATNSAAATPNSLSIGGGMPAIGFDPFKGQNNAGIERVIQPAVCASSQDVVVKVKNSGINVINSVTVNWKANGTTQTPFVLTAPIDTFGSPKNDTILTIGTVSFISGPVDIIAWVSAPNSSTDPDHSNDTIFYKMGASLNGIYSVGGSVFPTISSAVQALMDFGVCGPVTFRVDTQTFFEQVNIVGRVNGASTTNTIVFEGVDQQKSVIAWGPGIVNAKHIIKLQGAAYIIFRNLTVRSLSNTYGWGFHLLDTCKVIGIKKCILDNSAAASSATANNTAGISISGMPTGTCIPGPCATSLSTAARADSLEIDSNTFLYGYEAINITGNATTLLGTAHKIRNNKILYAYQNSINLVSQNNVLITNNTIFPRQTGAANVGIFLSAVGSMNATSRTIVNGNKISGYSTAGISLNNCLGSDSINKGLITNNFIGGMEQLIDANPVYITGCKNWSVSDNSINRDIPNSSVITAAGIRVLGTTSNITILNNIISIGKVGLGIPIHLLLASNVDSMNNNAFFRADTVTNNQLINIAGTAYSFANFKGAGGFNTNSAFVKPSFRNDTSLYLTNVCGLPVGLPLSYVSKDIDGTNRSNPPIVGAHEKILTNNNLAVISLKQPVSPIVPGTTQLKVLVQNLGGNSVVSFTTAYRLNGASPVTQVVTPGTPLGQCDTMTVTFSGLSIGINDSVVQFVVYTYLPNSSPDSDPSNDTIKPRLFTPLGGNYNIGGPNASFANFTEAVSALQASGIKSAVNFNVYPGTYNEQVTLTGPITGASPTNRISFDGFDSTNRVLTYSGNGGAPHTLKINNAPYVTFKNLKIQTTGSGYGWAIQISGISNACKIKNCAIDISGAGTSNTTTNFMGITVSGATVTTANRADSLEIDSNTINYGYQGINIYAATGSSVGQFNKIRNNIILNSQQYGIYLVYQQTPEVLNNIIMNRGSNAGVGIYCQNVTTPATGTLFTNISGNKLSNYATAGIYLNTCTNASSTLKGRITNNAIGGLEKLAAGNSLYATGSTNWNICNNSINHDYATTTAATAAAIRLVGAATATFGITLINNIIAVSGTGTGLPLYTQVLGNIDAMDYNLFYRADTTNGFMEYLGSNITYYALRGYNNFNKNSSIYRPGFTSTSNLTPNPADSASWSINGRGTYLAYAPVDINRIARPALNWDGVPDIGAFEFTPTSTPPVAKAIPDTSFAYSTQVFVFAGDTVAKITWASLIPGYIGIRQYSGVLPPSLDVTKNYMYFYTSSTTSPLAAIDLYYRDNWVGTHSSETGIRYEQMDIGVGSWTVYPTVSTIDTVKNFISMGFFNTPSSITYLSGTNNNPTILPVKLLNLTATKIGETVWVNWATASEINCDHFEVERSMDGKSYTTVGSCAARGNSTNLINYHFTDPLTNIPSPVRGLIYYRLKITDKDGLFTYSKIVWVNWDDALLNENVKVFPNPYSNELYIQVSMTSEDKNARLTLIDIKGKTLLCKEISLDIGEHTIRLDKDIELIPGIYFLSIEKNGSTQIVKLLKQ